MKTLNKKETEIQNTLARLRADNPPSLPATGVTATEKKARSEISRQRVSTGLKKVKTIDFLTGGTMSVRFNNLAKNCLVLCVEK